MINDPLMTREEWLTESAKMIMTDILEPALKDLGKEARPNFKYKISLGYAPNTKTGSNVFAVCLHSTCSSRGFNEIYVTPSSSDSMEILGAIVHELIHGLDDLVSGHCYFFATMGRHVDLAGPLTASYPGRRLKRTLKDYIELLGDIPHDEVNIGNMKRQRNKNHLVQCPSFLINPRTEEVEACGFRFNTSMKWINAAVDVHGRVPCILCDHDMMAIIK